MTELQIALQTGMLILALITLVVMLIDKISKK